MPKPIVKNVGEKNELHLNAVSASPKKQPLQQMDKMKTKVERIHGGNAGAGCWRTCMQSSQGK